MKLGDGGLLPDDIPAMIRGKHQKWALLRAGFGDYLQLALRHLKLQHPDRAYFRREELIEGLLGEGVTTRFQVSFPWVRSWCFWITPTPFSGWQAPTGHGTHN